MRKKIPMGLGKREQQIVNTLHKCGESSVAEVMEQLEKPPSYSAVRAMLGVLVEKGVLKTRKDGKRYLYRPKENAKKVRKTAVRRLVETFFGNSPVDAIATMLDVSSGDLSKEEIDRLQAMIGDLEERRDTGESS